MPPKPAAKFNIGATSALTVDKLTAWYAKGTTGDLEEDFEGFYLGADGRKKLQAAGIETTFQLVAKFLAGKGNDTSAQEACDNLYQFLASVGINSTRAKIVLLVAERAAMVFPGCFDRSELVAGLDVMDDE